ncbi:MAG: zf-TFIIB domain-containing protein [Cyanobacteria bacterium P01_H01_bin.121]
MLCPKDRQTKLTDVTLADNLGAKHCSCCQGYWLSSSDYEMWQASREPVDPNPDNLTKLHEEIEVSPSPYDTKAALCPECQNYLARARIGSGSKSFYVERCPSCGGIWCDGGEWDILESLDFHASIPTLFTQDWQTRARRRELVIQERQATIDKLGPELAERIFELAKLLEHHPNGDFGVAYLMRRFEQVE